MSPCKRGRELGGPGRGDAREADGELGEMIPAHSVHDHHVERSGRRALFVESPNVEARRMRATVHELVDGKLVAVEGEHDGLVRT